jgi:acyl dehydratase
MDDAGPLPAVHEVTTVNLPEHAGNPIHTDAGAQAAGFPAALVAGVDVYAYLTHLPLLGWGADWLADGGAEVRFRRPVFEADRLRGVVGSGPDDDGAWPIDGEVDGSARAVARVWRTGPPAWEDRDGEALEPLTMRLGDDWVRHGTRLGDAVPLLEEGGFVHPAAWPHLANMVFRRDLVDGPWIHTRSRIRHHAATRAGEAVATSTVVDRFDSRAGERVVLHVDVEVDGRPAATLEHEAIVSLASEG